MLHFAVFIVPALLTLSAPPADPETAFDDWAEEQSLDLFRVACDVDDTLGVTCYGVDETRTVHVATWEEGGFEVMTPTEPGMVSTDGLLSNSTPLDCALALLPPGVVVQAASDGDRAGFDDARDLCADVEERISENPDTNPDLLMLMVALNDAMELVASDLDAGVDPFGSASLDALNAAWQALSDFLTSN